MFQHERSAESLAQIKEQAPRLAATFGDGTRVDFDDYVGGGMLIISPVDMLLLQDMTLKTNWLGSFSRFVEGRQGPQGNPHWALPWMFCLHHMVAEGIVPEGDGGVIQQMCQHINNMRLHVYARGSGG